MGTCDGCRWWEPITEDDWWWIDDDHGPTLADLEHYGLCNLPGGSPGCLPPPKLWVPEPPDAGCPLVTHATFGCNQWEPVSPPD